MSDRMCPISAFAPAGRAPSNDNYELSSVPVMDAETLTAHRIAGRKPSAKMCPRHPKRDLATPC